MVLNTKGISVCFVAFLLASVFSNAQVKSFNSFDGVKIAYSDEGNGFPVVLIHGFINSRTSWDKTELKKVLLAKGYRVIAPDLRGNGDSDKPQSDQAYANDAEVRDLKLLANKLQLKEYDAVGYSRGSIVLAKLLTQENRIKKAVLGGMGIDFTNPDWDRRHMFAAAFVGKTTTETRGAVVYAKSIGADLRSLHLQQKHQPVTSKEALGSISAKVLVIAGDEDTDNGDPKALQEAIPNAELQLVPGEHNGTYKTAAFGEVILKFL
ncbi:alpha/beta hydrolase [uncultured Croceitalea sp.]|uniref:alpha/beta fold hydrolase n=1 Tax=uncultured Croceitalea sp. TaxID=1798908 RepID=UPI00330682D1